MSAVSGTPALVVGVDVGGTFTDLFVLDETSGQARIVKVPSTRGEEARGFMNGIARVVDADGPDAARAIATIVHGTTVGTNALLERKVARTGILTTRGFRDVLEMRRLDRPQTWGLGRRHAAHPGGPVPGEGPGASAAAGRLRSGVHFLCARLRQPGQ